MRAKSDFEPGYIIGARYAVIDKEREDAAMSEYQLIMHEFDPVFDGNSRILILGSFPSAKSREANFYYGHPRNRFWKILAEIYQVRVPETIPEKKALLLENHIALWDVIAQCEIKGSSDASIRNAVPTRLNVVLENAPIRQICCNGSTAYQLFHKYQENTCGQAAIRLPSSSPANAAWSLERLIEVWGEALRCGSEDGTAVR